MCAFRVACGGVACGIPTEGGEVVVARQVLPRLGEHLLAQELTSLQNSHGKQRLVSLPIGSDSIVGDFGSTLHAQSRMHARLSSGCLSCDIRDWCAKGARKSGLRGNMDWRTRPF